MKNKITIKNLRLVLFFILPAFFLACFQPVNKKKINFNQFLTQQIEKRDSLLVLHTVKEWGIKKWWTWAVRSDMYKITPDDVQYYFEGVFYSPERNKMMVWIGEKMPNAETLEVYDKKDFNVNKICPNAGDTVCFLSAIIGIRDSANAIWKFYPFDQEAVGCFSDRKYAVEELSNYYFAQMKNHQMYRVVQSGINKGELESQAYGYNLQDKDFWNKCWLFEKDTVGSYGLYSFQISRYDYKGGKCSKKCAVAFNPPIVKYPEELLKMYH